MAKHKSRTAFFNTTLPLWNSPIFTSQHNAPYDNHSMCEQAIKKDLCYIFFGKISEKPSTRKAKYFPSQLHLLTDLCNCFGWLQAEIWNVSTDLIALGLFLSRVQTVWERRSKNPKQTQKELRHLRCLDLKLQLKTPLKAIFLRGYLIKACL